jgi:hypothetical protein
MNEPKYKRDVDLVTSMSADERAKFTTWMAELDRAHEKSGRPYGAGSVWEATGAECWINAFREGYSATDALAEDLSYADC